MLPSSSGAGCSESLPFSVTRRVSRSMPLLKENTFFRSVFLFALRIKSVNFVIR